MDTYQLSFNLAALPLSFLFVEAWSGLREWKLAWKIWNLLILVSVLVLGPIALKYLDINSYKKSFPVLIAHTTSSSRINNETSLDFIAHGLG